ncbi:hypothetical protein ABZ297_25235 [Nonomuraea sp. NPDC005983]|uniref:hypothetical protein n=1 Tax=Nonomuraea sp. NPDC005983 TaxID=3155595 RepID=UPI0033B55F7F
MAEASVSMVTFLTTGIFVLVQGSVLVTGIVLTIGKRRQHGRAAMLGLAGCLVLLLEIVFNVVRSLTFPSLVDSMGIKSANTIVVVETAVSSLLSGVGIGLLIMAVVARRSSPQQPAAPGWQQPPPAWPQYPQQGEQGRPPAPGWQPSQQGEQGQPPAPGWQPSQPVEQGQPSPHGWQPPQQGEQGRPSPHGWQPPQGL